MRLSLILTAVQRFFADQSVGAHLAQSLVVVALSLLLLLAFNRLIEVLTPKVARRADAITTDQNVLRLRRIETFAGLAITIVRVLVVICALVLIWKLSNPSSQPLALIGLGALVALLANATVAPLLRDMTYGLTMIAERWYNIGDHVVIEPFTNSGGVVERVTLRSTKLRSVTGEAIWFHHQFIQGVRVTSTASHLLALETFVNDPDVGQKVIEDAIRVVPVGPTTIPRPLVISEVKRIDTKLWRITVVGEVTPFREWIIDDFAVNAIKKTDTLTGKDPVIVYGPIVYYADVTAAKRYRRSAAVRKRLRAAAAK